MGARVSSWLMEIGVLKSVSPPASSSTPSTPPSPVPPPTPPGAAAIPSLPSPVPFSPPTPPPPAAAAAAPAAGVSQSPPTSPSSSPRRLRSLLDGGPVDTVLPRLPHPTQQHGADVARDFATSRLSMPKKKMLPITEFSMRRGGKRSRGQIGGLKSLWRTEKVVAQLAVLREQLSRKKSELTSAKKRGAKAEARHLHASMKKLKVEIQQLEAALRGKVNPAFRFHTDEVDVLVLDVDMQKVFVEVKKDCVEIRGLFAEVPDRKHHDLELEFPLPHDANLVMQFVIDLQRIEVLLTQWCCEELGLTNSRLLRYPIPDEALSEKGVDIRFLEWYFALIFPKGLGLNFATTTFVFRDYWNEDQIWELLKLIPFEVEIAEEEGEGLKEDEPSGGPPSTVYDVLLKNRDLWDVVTRKWSDIMQRAERAVDGVPSVVRLVLTYYRALKLGGWNRVSTKLLQFQLRRRGKKASLDEIFQKMTAARLHSIESKLPKGGRHEVSFYKGSDDTDPVFGSFSSILVMDGCRIGVSEAGAVVVGDLVPVPSGDPIKTVKVETSSLPSGIVRHNHFAWPADSGRL